MKGDTRYLLGTVTIADWLRRRALEWREHSSGAVFVRLGGEDETTPQLHALFLLQGTEEPLLVLRVNADRAIPRSLWPSALAVTNAWNAHTYVPKAMLVVADYELDSTGALVLEGALPGQPWVPQTTFDHFADSVVAGARAFWNGQDELLRG